MDTTNNSPRGKRGTWFEVTLAALRRNPRLIYTLARIYGDVEADAPDLVEANPKNWRPKVRQQLQLLRKRGLASNPEKGHWKATEPEAPGALDR